MIISIVILLVLCCGQINGRILSRLNSAIINETSSYVRRPQRYFLSSRQVEWSDAVSQCLRINSHLATVRSQDDAKELADFLVRSNDFANDYWLSGFYVPSSNDCIASPFQNKCWKWSQTSTSEPETNIDTSIIGFENSVEDVHATSRITLMLQDEDKPYLGFADGFTTRKFICDLSKPSYPLPVERTSTSSTGTTTVPPYEVIYETRNGLQAPPPKCKVEPILPSLSNSFVAKIRSLICFKTGLYEYFFKLLKIKFFF